MHLYPHSVHSPRFVTRNQHHMMVEFSDDRSVSGHRLVFLSAMMPRHYSGGPLIVRIMWMAKTESPGNMYWAGYFERHDATKDMDDYNFYGGVGWVGPCGNLVYTDLYYSLATLPAGMLPGEHLRMYLNRFRQDTVNDTLNVPAQLLAVTVREANPTVEREDQFDRQFPLAALQKIPEVSVPPVAAPTRPADDGSLSRTE